ncbi:LacI family DNA-binding transcriptional regulator [Devosia sp. Leaf64]|uniref:LacI family DNA-binding transcriptional regulator n=1 Tax=unclassified Devosia TaxID=196773 RepID=UPI0007159213|nr:LacI family DNA-binding transcriptional regulator [Devosia sp. Leaf64]KQN72953.1 LacI family transcriptional regulator [Devosia sp. Leaf64]KQT51895.1 LacI family transcriptional regulator [Devosia sp. Leaf420]
MDSIDKKRSNAPANRRLKEGVERRATMTDIAREVGCSQATVSFVLNNAPGIRLSDETRRRVFETARRIGYDVPSAARTVESGRPGRGQHIAFLVDQLATSPEAVQAIEGLSQAAQAAGGLVFVAQSRGDEETERDLVEAFVRQGATALVYMTIFTREVKLPKILQDLDIPVLLLNCYAVGQAVPAVVPSEIAGGQRATHHLISKGHQRIATITGEAWMEAAQDRLKGYRRALATADIPFDDDLVFAGDWSASAGYEATRKILDLPEVPTAIFCQNDRMAIGCYEALKEAGYQIPRDMSVVGYDDEEIARHLHPQLTTSVLPHRAMGQWIAEQLADGQVEARYPLTKLECPLVERASVGKPRP